MKLFVFFVKYVFRYLKFYWRTQTRYDVHSPFVSDFLTHTVEDRRHYYIFDDIISHRETLALNDDPIKVIDFGAGSQLGNQEQTTVCKIAKNSAISPIAGRLLFRIVKFLQPKTILELGTSLGISGIYQLSAGPQAKLLTIEGNPEIAALARRQFQQAGMDNAQVLEGAFKDVLPKIVRPGTTFDFFHFDGDHRYQPTLDYFELCLGAAHNNSVFCIGDIYWSGEMQQAWDQLRKDPRVSLSIDLFHFGLLFLRSEQREKEDFTLIAGRWKPWRMGFF